MKTWDRAAPCSLPDQAGAHPHLLVSAGKNGTIYVVDRDTMGHFGLPDDAQIRTDSSERSTQNRFDRRVLGRHLRTMDFTSAGWRASAAIFRRRRKTLRTTRESIGGAVWLTLVPTTPSISANGKDNGIVWVVGTEEPDTRTVIGAYFHRIDVSSRSIYRKPGEFTRKVERTSEAAFSIVHRFSGSS
jgi:hypothetical protein